MSLMRRLKVTLIHGRGRKAGTGGRKKSWCRSAFYGQLAFIKVSWLLVRWCSCTRRPPAPGLYRPLVRRGCRPAPLQALVHWSCTTPPHVVQPNQASAGRRGPGLASARPPTSGQPPTRCILSPWLPWGHTEVAFVCLKPEMRWHDQRIVFIQCLVSKSWLTEVDLS